MNIAIFVAALTLDFTVGFIGANLGSKPTHVRSLQEVTTDVEKLLATLNYNGPKVIVSISPNHSDTLEAFAQYSPVFDQINLVVFPHVLVHGSKKYRTILGHEVCHILHDQDMLLAKVRVSPEIRDVREREAWSCGKRLSKDKKLWENAR